MENKTVLRDGLSIISQCKKQTNDIWHAHFGAAAIASYFFMKDNNMEEEINHCMYSQTKMMLNNQNLDEIIDSKEEIDFQSAEKLIIKSMEHTIDELHWVGHNVIYAALSLLAMKELQKWGNNQAIEGITNLILSFRKTIPGRSWIGFTTKEVKQLSINDEIESEFKNPKQLSKFILKELSQFNIIYRAEAHHDLIGHLLTFSHAINIMYDLGHRDIFQRGIRPLLKLVYVLRASQYLMPNTEINLHSPIDRLPLIESKRAHVLPTENQFWLKDYSAFDWDFGHVFKFSYSYFDHIKRAPEYKDITLEKFRFVINT
ncbi:hypothetical protein CN575_21870 [Bacillus wiedmannii]|uniref:Uncharacterized protein n=2 Tax=Bacillus cereus group TaxID=86661 RepID=A0A1C4DUN0_BACTU|nr:MULTISPECIES: hypothetical protein [Bacillus cereus group]MCC2328855.1 hypothetical protein [Bacillus wiedmannii]MCU5501308.1 hypothetical protein [Bacillus wiedmannii]MED3026046.1 hypothetical protein [Bacillus wiedmannii]OTX95320.1 hypothetical protein BK729_21750 [Bacillus thuringiensis serovar wratislaviensis]OUB53969.1 hypothetical protein BK743_27195 [Bacillus thuringiensis serovar sylvestriensis]